MTRPKQKVWQKLPARQQQQVINLLVQMLLRQVTPVKEKSKS
jgi:hypothetical protein